MFLFRISYIKCVIYATYLKIKKERNSHLRTHISNSKVTVWWCTIRNISKSFLTVFFHTKGLQGDFKRGNGKSDLFL